MISLVVPFLDAFDKLTPCIDRAIKNSGSKDWELILIDNGSKKRFDYSKYNIPIKYIHNKDNTGVLATYKQGWMAAAPKSDIVAFIHSDVLIHGQDWVNRINKAFKNDPELGLAGFFGARGIGVDGGRSYSISNMQGKVWGRCECHEVAAWHHGEPMLAQVLPATVLDGLAMIFKKTALYRLIEETDAFDEWRSPFHFYDKILSLKLIKMGYHLAVINIEHDHFSGATANHSQTYKKWAANWFKSRGMAYDIENPDQSIYLLAEKQMFDEFRKNFPVNVDLDYNYEWSFIK